MNMLLHGMENPDIRNKDSLSEDHSGDADFYTLILANPPFAGSLDHESCAKDLQQIVKTKKDRTPVSGPVLTIVETGWTGGGDRAGWRIIRLLQSP